MLDISPERGWQAVLADAEIEARARLLRRAWRIAAISVTATILYAVSLWLLSENSFTYNAIIVGVLFAITQTTSWWRFIASKRRMRLGLYGTSESEAELIGDIIAKAQQESGTPGPSSDLARLGRQERMRELYAPPPNTEAAA